MTQKAKKEDVRCPNGHWAASGSVAFATRGTIPSRWAGATRRLQTSGSRVLTCWCDDCQQEFRVNPVNQQQERKPNDPRQRGRFIS